jgi:hypothetical protein
VAEATPEPLEHCLKTKTIAIHARLSKCETARSHPSLTFERRGGRYSRRQLFFNAARSNSPSAPNVMVSAAPDSCPRAVRLPWSVADSFSSFLQSDLLRNGLHVDCVAPQTESHPGHHDYISRG